jgi:PadR family transcriptional regulator PadR
MPAEVKITTTVAKVLRIFLEDPARLRYGFEIMQLTQLASGTLYPILARLEQAGWLAGRREDIDPSNAGRPRRRLYMLSERGIEGARYELAALSEQLRPPPLRSIKTRPQGSEG